MKKLNNKGFTLVELLAVIIILAIVVGISIPAITSVINNSKNNALGVVVDAAEDFLADQYALYNVDTTSANDAFKAAVTGPVTSAKTLKSATAADQALLKAMGFKLENVTEVKFTITDAGVACVTVTKIPTTSEYYSTTYFTASGTTATPKTTADYYSRSCSSAL